jgi:hypothetical protein
MLDFSFKWNRAVRRIMGEAKRVVRERLRDRNDVSVIDLLLESGVPPIPAAMNVAEGLARALGVAAGRLRPGDRLADLCRVSRQELGAVTDEVWSQSKFGEFAEVGSYDLMFLVETASASDGRTERWRTLEPAPKNEEEWLDRIMEMRVGEFLRFCTLAGTEAPWRDAV